MQYAICSVRVRPGAPDRQWVVILQHAAADITGTRLVAPLATATDMRWVARLHPRLLHEGTEYFIAIDQLAAIPLKAIGPPSGSAEHLRDEITRALDLVFTGF